MWYSKTKTSKWIYWSSWPTTVCNTFSTGTGLMTLKVNVSSPHQTTSARFIFLDTICRSMDGWGLSRQCNQCKLVIVGSLLKWFVSISRGWGAFVFIMLRIFVSLCCFGMLFGLITRIYWGFIVDALYRNHDRSSQIQ